MVYHMSYNHQVTTCTSPRNTVLMWQSRVEIEHYSVAYFDCVIVFRALQDRTSFKGGAHTHSVDSWTPDKSTQCI